MNTGPLHVVVLAAGAGTRMKSALPKVLHPLAGRPLLAHVLDTARRLEPAAMHVVVGHGAAQVQAAFAHAGDLRWVEQAERLGTGHAVRMALQQVPDDARVLVLYGDVPLVDVATLRPLLTVPGLALLAARVADPTGYGRILRDAGGALVGIVEDADATPAQRAIDEINTGILAAPAAALRGWLARVGNDNARGEFYLTDVVALAVADHAPCAARLAADAVAVAGVNDRAQLAAAERLLQRRQAETLMRAGVWLCDPARFDLRGRLHCGQDVRIEAGCLFEGEVELGDAVSVGPGCVLRDVRVGAGTRIDAYSVLESAQIGGDCRIGPYARLRPGTVLAAAVHVGNFVEIKNSRLGAGSKANHLSYLGDAEIGSEVNVGAGTITCNYDGANKHRTVIEDRAFIGSDTALVAPVRIGHGATIGAGSVITEDAPAEALTVSRARGQNVVPGWRRPQKPTADR